MTTDITELAQREKFEAWFVNDVVGADVNFPAFKDGEYAEGEIYDEQLYFMLQAMWMAWKAANAELVEALEKAQGMEAYWKTQCRGITDHCEELQARIAELESRTVKLPKFKMLEDYLAEVAIEERKQILVGVKLEFHRACAAAGIKVEAE
ncbi:hypothetical protein ATN83_3982 [Raoultella ornithinolytica]|uniref:hypothetical protein n=1 Tax=Raoultella ornithinolytica TaxID=54291 RepID=UPI0007217F5B|nr:hypothetical protein [Raoultella ornithinolytica]ALQ48091.1 hypothetical protein ATN83_3982 [Raoultella ornithinolytica]